MMTTHRISVRLAALALVAAAALGACGGDDSSLSPLAEEGRSIYLTNGCGACHGTEGQGGVGPAFVGLAGRTVYLDDGTTVIADRDYIIESIRDPEAKRPAGFQMAMPTGLLSDEQIDKLIAYIDELSPPPATDAP